MIKKKKENVIVSACLLGVGCRYDGKEKEQEGIRDLIGLCHLIPVCPEQMGGLKTPRDPAEQRDERVVTCTGEDVTAAYKKGAEEVWKLSCLYGCRYALLKEKSPSCGCGRIYDGSFGRKLIPGDGITAALLKEKGITVMGEGSLERLKKLLEEEPDRKS